ncbi:hypothetical protein DEU56DRAFT_914742 [Suillus clintonianus]|uniref:uncharacterized protein n=1 Tax=Suillus clintonianus TaxID=1904413 RepID=UPI001B885E83|nr:uncharacterized protein DEU56DRAFT_914742 [Suillus clintonianus]KAG2130743.1 hypothetical protein DEU56DRAFT_914742 [Suillus clintonianus]
MRLTFQQSIQDPTASEANLVMDLVRAKCDVYQAQKALADCVMRENEMLASLLRFRAEEAEKRLDDTDMGLGCMRVMFKENGWTHISSLTRTPGSHLQPVEVTECGRQLTIQLD